MKLVIGITGGSCSGKTSVVESLCNYFGNKVTIMKQDSYYLGLPQNTDSAKYNFDDPQAIEWNLFKENLNKLKNNKEIDEPIYSFKEHKRLDDIIKIIPNDIILVEGILIFHNDELRDLFDLRIYIDAESDIRYRRRMNRDMIERGRTLDSINIQWDNFVKPNHNSYIENIKKFCHIILNNDIQQNNFDSLVGLEILKVFIENKLLKMNNIKN